jgi:hypothetical protein
VKLYIANWPDGSISILNAKNKLELSLRLDIEANPDHAKITELNFPDEQIHLTTSVAKGTIQWDICPEYMNATKKKIKL